MTVFQQYAAALAEQERCADRVFGNPSKENREAQMRVNAECSRLKAACAEERKRLGLPW